MDPTAFSSDIYSRFIELSDTSVDINTRMPEKVSDWRKILSDPAHSPTITDHLFRKDTWEKFYSQHGSLFRRALGDKRFGAVVLDIGCGDAFGVENWVNECRSYHGIDYSPDMLNLARDYLPVQSYPHVTFYRGAADTSYFKNDFADFVISSEVIEHLDDPRNHIKNLKRLVKKGGYISLSTPCSYLYFYPSEILTLIRSREGRSYWRKAIRCHDYWTEMLPHHPALSPKALRSMFDACELQIIRHYSCVFYIQTRWQLSLRMSRYLERKKVRAHIQMIRKCHQLYEKILDTGLPLLKFMGTRQFILAKKT